MIEPSLRAVISDLLGGDADAEFARRPTVRQALARAEPGQVVAARQGRREVCVAVTGDGRSFVVPDRCPHDGSPLSSGFIEGGRLVCARHGWEFDLETGRCPLRPEACLERVELERAEREIGARRGGQRGQSHGRTRDRATGTIAETLTNSREIR